jgi:hypothetical protein
MGAAWRHTIAALIANAALAWISTDRESPNAGVAYLIHLTQEFGSDVY